MKPPGTDNNGFTLIEIIVTLTVAAILATLLMQFIGTSVSRSAEPALELEQAMELQRVFELMNADYKRLLLTDLTPLVTFASRVSSPVASYGASSALATQTQCVQFVSQVATHDGSTSIGNTCRLLKVTATLGHQTLTGLFTN